ncbi:MAG: hypothetical protein NC927_00650 [Candidatus Omnitrophica bacterium]|nr:hypothetical protein [Candidatus Omnitrophota bacterium]
MSEEVYIPEERRFKIRGDLIINAINEKKKTGYLIINPLTGETLRLNQRNYLILRHFQGRDITSLRQHLSNKHKIYLTRKALENYRNFFLNHYLFEDCLEIYLQKITLSEKEALALKLAEWLKEYRDNQKDGFSWLEEMVLNQAIQASGERDIFKAISYFCDLEKLNSKNKIANWVLNRLEEEVVKVAKDGAVIKQEGLTLLRPTVAGAGVLLIVGILAVRIFFSSFYLSPYSRETLRIIKTTAEELIQNKILALTTVHGVGDNLK